MRKRFKIIIPVERDSRELNSSLKLKKILNEAGFKVKIINSKLFHTFFPFFPPSLVLENDVTFQGYKTLIKLKDCGFKIFSHDEESFNHPSDEMYFSERICLKSLNCVEVFFTRGQSDKDLLLKKYKDLKTRLVPSNNYRFTNLKENFSKNSKILDKVSSLRRKYNKVVLIASRFSHTNRNDRLHSIDLIVKKRKKKFNLNNFETEEVRDFLLYNRALFNAVISDYKKLILSNPETLFVLRSHPSENKIPWEEIAINDNAIFDNSGTFLEWAYYSDIIIHNGCTTGIEAFLLKKKVIYYDPLEIDKKFIQFIPKIASEFITSFSDLNLELNKSSFIINNFESKLNDLKMHMELDNDFGNEFIKNLNELEDPKFKLKNRILFIFSKLFLIKLFYLIRTKIKNLLK